MAELTVKQDKFCLEYLKDGNASRAYREAYDCDNMKEATINRAAKELIDNPNITTRINELRKQTTTSAILSIEERKELLTKIANNIVYDQNGNANYNDARGAIDLLNKMDGVYVQKNQTEINGVVTIKIDPRVL